MLSITYTIGCPGEYSRASCTSYYVIYYIDVHNIMYVSPYIQ